MFWTNNHDVILCSCQRFEFSRLSTAFPGPSPALGTRLLFWAPFRGENPPISLSSRHFIGWREECWILSFPSCVVIGQLCLGDPAFCRLKPITSSNSWISEFPSVNMLQMRLRFITILDSHVVRCAQLAENLDTKIFFFFFFILLLPSLRPLPHEDDCKRKR